MADSDVSNSQPKEAPADGSEEKHTVLGDENKVVTSKNVQVGDRTVRVFGADDEAVADAERTVKEDVNLVDLDIDDPEHANLTYDQMQNGDAPVAEADPTNAGDNVNDSQGRVIGAKSDKA